MRVKRGRGGGARRERKRATIGRTERVARRWSGEWYSIGEVWAEVPYERTAHG